MPQRASSRGDRGKAPIYAMSHGDTSFDNGTIFAGEQAAQVLQSHFNRESDNIRPTNEIPLETRSKRWHSTETVSTSSESCTISSGASSWRVLATRKGTFGGETPTKDLFFCYRG